MGYHAHYVVDGGKARVILNVLVTPADVTENQPMLDLLWRTIFRWRARVRRVTGDANYGTKEIIAAVEKASIRAYVSMADFEGRSPYYGASRFVYDAERDLYRCPQGEPLRLYTHSYTERLSRYRADPESCNACPLKPECTPGDSGRVLMRSFDEELLERVKAYRGSAPYEKALRKRRVWVEPMFGEAKEWHGMRSFRLRTALAGERGGYGDRRGTEHKATAHVLGQGTEEVGAGRGPAASGTDPFGEQPTPPGKPSSEIHTAPRTFFNGLAQKAKFAEFYEGEVRRNRSSRKLNFRLTEF